MDAAGKERVLGVDYGRRRTGLALSDPGRRLASPAGVIRSRGLEDLASRIDRFARENDALTIVMGHPRHMDGRPGDLADDVDRLARLLESRGLRVILRDEGLTSWDARQRLREGGETRPRKERIDEAAATVILQDYLEEAGA